MTSNGIRWLFWGKSPISDIPMLQKIAECLFIQQEGVYIWVEKRQVWSRWFVSEYEMGEHVLKNGVFRYTSNYGNFKEERNDHPRWSFAHKTPVQKTGWIASTTSLGIPKKLRRNWGCCLESWNQCTVPQILWFIIIFAIDNTYIYILYIYIYIYCIYIYIHIIFIRHMCICM